KAVELLEMVGMAHRKHSRLNMLSGGEQQRVAIAIALANHPKLLLADEPTGALDSKATDELLRLFAGINRSGQTILMVTHSVKAASHAGRVLFIRDGEVFHQIYRGSSTNEQLYQKISDTLTLLATQPGRIGQVQTSSTQPGHVDASGQQALGGREGTI
ncbi:MAG: ATP-binding cassette domain-containing protein, partial [Acetatifactor sp.]|nr:ATP-binding cassette domain-containing protein [Acetatifactor sp.]